MKRRLWIVALIIGLSGALLTWERAAAESPDEATGAVAEGYVYEVLPGLLPDTSAGTIALTDGWHVAQHPYAGLDFAYVTTGTTNAGDPVYAVIRTVRPPDRIPQLAPPPQVAARIGPNTNFAPISIHNTGCRQVEIEFFHPVSDSNSDSDLEEEAIATIFYKHTYPAVRPNDAVPLAALASSTPTQLQIGELAAVWDTTSSDEAIRAKRDGSGCYSEAEHLHQEAPFFQGQHNIHRNVPAHNRSDPASAPTSLTLRYGFLTQGEGGDPNNRLLPSQYRPVCADTWVFRVQASATPPDPSPIANCAAPATDSWPTMEAAALAEEATQLTIRWSKPPDAWDDPDTTERAEFMDGYAVTAYEFQHRVIASGGIAGPWSDPPVRVARADITVDEMADRYETQLTFAGRGVSYQVRARAVNSRGEGGYSTTTANGHTWAVTTVEPNANVREVRISYGPATAAAAGAAGAAGGDSITCGPSETCELVIPPDAGTVTVTAIPQDGYVLTAWGGACTGQDVTRPCALQNVTTNQTVSVTVAADTAPRFDRDAASYSFTVGAGRSYTLPAASGGNGALRYHLSTTPAWLSFAADTRTLWGWMRTRRTGTATYTYTVADADGNTAATDQDTMTITVTVVDAAPALPTVRISGGSAVTEGADARFTISRTGDTAAALPVFFAASDGAGDFLGASPPTTVTIAAGQASAALAVATVNDGTDEPDGVVAVTITATAAYNLGSPSVAVVPVRDDDEPPVTIAAGPSPITEGTAARFTLTRTGDTTAAVTVTVAVTESGAMIAGTAPGTVQFAANAASGTLTVPTADDAVDEADSTITATIRDGAGYDPGTPATAAVTVQDNECTRFTLTVSAGPGGTISGGGSYCSGTIVPVTAIPDPQHSIDSWGGACAARTPSDTTCDVVVDANKTVSIAFAADTAPQFDQDAADYTFTVGAAGSAELPTASGGNGTLRYHLSGTPAWLTFDAATRTLSGTPASTGTATYTYTVADADSNTAAADQDTMTITVTVEDSPPPLPAVSISGGPAVTEGAPATFTVSRTGETTQALDVVVTVSESGDMIDGDRIDITDPVTVTIPPNAPTATLTVPTDDDTRNEDDSVITATIQASQATPPDYRIGVDAGTDAVTVADDDDAAPVLPTVRISGGSAVTEGAAATFTISRTGGTAAALDVFFTVSDGPDDFLAATPPTMVRIAAGQAAAALAVATVNDGTDEPDGVITVTITAHAAYERGTPSVALVLVRDDDEPPVTIAAGPSPITEGTAARFTLTRTGDTTAAVTVTVAVTESGAMIAGTAPGTVPFAANATSGILTVPTDDDAVDEGDSIITATIRDGAGYDPGSPPAAAVTVQDNDCTRFTLTVSKSGNGSITGGGSYCSGDVVTVTATPDAQHTIASWGGACAGTAASSSTCAVTMNADKSVSVTFGKARCTFTVTAGANGSVSGGGTYDCGAKVTATASPNTGYAVDSWSGACSGSSTTCMVTLTTDKSAHVTFKAPPCTRPPDDTRTVTLSTTTIWQARGNSSVYITTTVTRTDTRPHVRIGPPPPCAWRDGTTWVLGPQSTEVTEIIGEPRPGPYWEADRLSESQTQWSTVATGTFCLQYEERRTGMYVNWYLRSYIAGTSGWVLAPRGAPDRRTDTNWGAWQRTGVTRLCPQSSSGADGVAGQEAAPAAQLPAGDYLFDWGTHRFQFRVPAGAVVQLRARTLASGTSVAVFTAADGTELIVDPATLSADGAAAGAEDQFPAVSEPTLATLAATLRPAAPAEPPAGPVVVETQVCPVAAPDAQGSLAVDLEAQLCTVVRGGGSVTVRLGDAAHPFTLDAALDWLVIDGTIPDGAAAVTFVTTPNETHPHSGALTLALGDGAELTRAVPPEAPELTAVFDALAATAPPEEQ